jgi:hypothetical protein
MRETGEIRVNTDCTDFRDKSKVTSDEIRRVLRALPRCPKSLGGL